MNVRVPMSRDEVVAALGIRGDSLTRRLRKTRARLNAGLPLEPWDMPLPEPGGWWWSDDIAAHVAARAAAVERREIPR
jgi:hypothetical protein